MIRLPSLPLQAAVPAEHRSNFIHLYFDIAWFGVLNGSTLSFVTVYMARLGASAFQIGLFSAGPAMVTLLFALPSGWWLKSKPLHRSAFWSAFLFRAFYLLWILFPVFLAPRTQVWAFVGFTLLMSIPGTILAISFNALFAATVPPEWRGHVTGVRNALLAVTFILTSLLCGALLTTFTFPLGFQVVFGVGFVGAALSTMHLRFIKPVTQSNEHLRTGRSLGDAARPGAIRIAGDAFRASVGLRFMSRFRMSSHIFEPLRGSLGRIILVLFLFHLTLFLPGSLFPVYWVDRLRLTDQEISMGNALFYLSVFLISIQLPRLSHRLGHFRVLVMGATLLVAYPTITGFTREVTLFLFNSVLGGAGWSLAGGALNNYLLENIPDGDRSVPLAWYNLTLNAAMLISSLLGPGLAHNLGLVTTLFLVGFGRLLSALAIWRWGRT